MNQGFCKVDTGRNNHGLMRINLQDGGILPDIGGMEFMRWLKERKYRIWISLAAGLAGVMLLTTFPGVGDRSFGAGKRVEGVLEQPSGIDESPSLMTAWWGTLYPKFCFSETSSGSEVKISFWLAKVLGWC